jgi:hypothetical protein
MKTEPREMFSAIFEKYDSGSKFPASHICLNEVRSRKGGIIKDNLKLEENAVAKMPKNLSYGDYVAFLADIEFKNVEFMNIFELSRSSL